MSADMFQAKSTDIFLLIHSLRITVGVHNTHTHRCTSDSRFTDSFGLLYSI